jgi:hypothetical protein
MEYSTPGVYIREVDSGAKPIASVATSIPGFLGLFKFSPPVNAIAITGSDGTRQITGKLPPQLVDKQGKVTGNASSVAQELTEAMRLKQSQVKDVSKFLKLHGVSVGGKTGASFKETNKGVEISFKGKTYTAISGLIDEKGQVKTAEASDIDDLLSGLVKTFELVASPKTASDVLEAYGYSFDGAAESSLQSEYSIPPVGITNKAEFSRWLKSFFAQYLYDTRPVEELVGENIEDPDEAVDAIYDALDANDSLKKEFFQFLSEPSVFNFVSGINGFYDNGGGKCYVYLMGVGDIDCSIRENQADKLGLYSFDDAEDIAIMAAPGLNSNQQKEMLELCEIRKDRFAILDGPIVSDGSMEIPASAKGYGALYVPWFKITKPSWFTETQDLNVSGPNRRKLQKN